MAHAQGDLEEGGEIMAATRRVTCPLCGGEMRKASVGNCGGITLGCLLVVLALVISAMLFPIGPVIGIPLFIFALFCGGKRAWRCRACGHWLPR